MGFVGSRGRFGPGMASGPCVVEDWQNGWKNLGKNLPGEAVRKTCVEDGMRRWGCWSRGDGRETESTERSGAVEV